MSPGGPGAAAGSGGGGTKGPGSSASGGGRSPSPPPPSPPPAAPPPPASARGGGWIAGIVGGVVGALLAVFGAPLLQGPPELAPEAADRLASVETSTATQDDRLDAVASQVAELQLLADELEPTVRGAVETAVEALPSQDAAAIAALDERLAALADEVATLAETTAAAVDALPLLSEQSERLAALQTTLGALDSRLAAESARQDGARGEVSSQLDAALAAAGERVDELIAAVTGQVEAARDEGGAAVAEVQAALEGEIAELRQILQAAEGELTTVKASLEELQQARGRAAAAALLVREIDQTIDAGERFDEPLERLLAMSGDDDELEATLATLRPYAESGVPTIAALRADLAALAETSPTPTVAGSEWLGRTVDNITGLVAVRDKESEVDIATGRLAEADQALRDGDVGTAIARVEEVAGMPDGVDPAAAERWLEAARARLAAEAAQERLDAHIRELLTATVN